MKSEIKRKWQMRALIALLALGVISCNDLAIDLRGAKGFITIVAADATFAVSEPLVVEDSKLKSKATSTSYVGCDLGGSNGASSTSSYEIPYSLDNAALAHANLFTAPTYMRIRDVKIRAIRVSSPGGDAEARLFASSGLDPTGSALVTSQAVSISSISTNANGALATFAMPASPGYYDVSAGTYSIVLRPAANANPDGANFFAWVTGDSVSACTSVANYRQGSSNGTVWVADSSPDTRPSVFQVTADVHGSPGVATWIVSGGGKRFWKMSTFDFLENPDGNTTGTIRYEIGAGDDGSTPTFTYVNKTEAEVQGLGTLTGNYLYVKATLSVTAPAFDRAVLGNGSVQAE